MFALVVVQRRSANARRHLLAGVKRSVCRLAGRLDRHGGRTADLLNPSWPVPDDDHRRTVPVRGTLIGDRHASPIRTIAAMPKPYPSFRHAVPAAERAARRARALGRDDELRTVQRERDEDAPLVRR
jgi:hypothetical protein